MNSIPTYSNILVWFILLFCSCSSNKSIFAITEFDFGTLTLSNLKLLGDAHLGDNNSVQLTRDLAVPNSGAGKALYSKPVRFRQPGLDFPASFSTFFSFSVTNLNPSSIGGGLAFVLTPNDESVGDAGGYMGILDSKGTQSGTILVEFDTLMDVEFKDINGNHVGLDLNSMVSTQVGDLDSIGVDLKSGDIVNSWIEYSGSTGQLNVFVSYSNLKPKEPFLSVVLNIAEYVNDFMFVGFSGSTQGSTEIHSIEWWSFSSSFDASPKSAAAAAPPPPTASLMNPTADSVMSRPPSMAPSESNSSASIMQDKSSGKCHSNFCKQGPGAVVGVVTASAFFLAFATLVLIWLYTKKFKKVKNSEFLASDVIKMPKEFSYKELKLATKAFDSTRIIGHGAFGTVYKGILSDNGGIVAVKRCSHNGQGKAEFLSELSIIGTLRHRNLVRLQGWCHEKGEILLVYDLMPNGSLDKALFESRMILPWLHRRKILLGVASALAYLHQECENQVIHRDIKSSNIMLDEGFNARLGDFGLARQVEHDKSPDATVAAGTMGYLAPEYLLTGRATEKTDVFSYGAVVLEVASGRRPIERETTRVEKVGVNSNLVEWVWGLHREGNLLMAADSRLYGEFDEGEMRRVLMVGLACSQPDPMVRPTMRSVVQMLVGEAEVPIVPRTKPSMSFSTSHLLMTLQDSVSDLNGMITLSTSSSENSFTGVANGMMDLV
ncbi:L-type lectin-domain containing receptor kinase VIII.1-like [Nicotiana sylvestris]|uniref:non-specific serine/threonine protein kinase n=1 Tax=Nicotiana sylvestris TaxID=4096 RepID=A0A1U7UM72_NICSY|nr:PREDICTED: L-type lectin-domain containing receptor kinase VIII.1-like [Nicotiana sylvestris]XP_016504388.1 PREDICTED: L-type lectin-domain containing receptor kinase VIII.1-like [Nicotiana tabacum]